MPLPLQHPGLLATLCALILWLLAFLGSASRRRRDNSGHAQTTGSLSLALAATLTLLGLSIGSTLADATTHRHQRQVYEAQEAGAIRAAYLRANLLPAPRAGAIRALLLRYLERRIDTCSFTSPHPGPADAETISLQAQLWQAILQPAPAATSVTSLLIDCMNDVLTARAYTQSVWWNRTQSADWTIVIFIACAASLLTGLTTTQTRSIPRSLSLLVLPLLVACSLFVISSIESPSSTVLRTQPRNLQSLAHALPTLP